MFRCSSFSYLPIFSWSAFFYSCSLSFSFSPSELKEVVDLARKEEGMVHMYSLYSDYLQELDTGDAITV